MDIDGSRGTLVTPLVDSAGEPRVGGLRKFQVALSRPVNAATAQPGAVSGRQP